MKDVIGFGSLSISLFFEIKNPKILDLRTEEFEEGGESFGDAEDFQHYLDFVSHIGRKVWRQDGGEEASVALALAKMGFDIGFLGKVGKDKFGDFLIEMLDGVDTSQIIKGGFTGVSLVLMPEQGRESSLIFLNANNSLAPEEVDLTYLNNSRFLHMGSFRGDVSYETQKQVVREISPSVKLSFQVDKSDVLRGLQKVLPFIARSYVVFLDNHELQSLTNKDHETGAKELLDYGAANIACQMGDGAWYVASQKETLVMPASKKLDFEKKSHAKSFFVAGFLASLLLAKPLDESVAIATEIVTRLSSDFYKKSLPDKELLDMVLLERQSLKER